LGKLTVLPQTPWLLQGGKGEGRKGWEGEWKGKRVKRDKKA